LGEIQEFIEKAVPIGSINCARNDEEIVWLCGECNSEYETEDEAEECCKPDEDKETLYDETFENPGGLGR